MQQNNIAYLEKLKVSGIKPGLERMNEVSTLLNNPQNKYPIIHIAGTNGKGSTATITASILKAAGYKVGLFISPYVINYNERTQINGIPISNSDLEIWIEKIRSISEENNVELTFFEFSTLLSFSYFADQKVDIAVIEVGLGGLWDATNIVNSKISAITNIGLDHQNYLGNTKEKIAREKAGIIKQNQEVITAETDPIILDLLQNTADEKQSTLTDINKVITAEIIEQDFNHQTFKTEGIYNDTFTLSLLGDHQIKNALTAFTIIDKLQNKFNVSIEAIKEGTKQAKLPGRLQVITSEPLTIIDGAHNIDGMKSLKHFIKDIPNKKVLIIGLSSEKDPKEMLDQIAKDFETIIVTKGNFKPLPPQEIADAARKFSSNVLIYENISDAIEKAKSLSSKQDFILIAGTLYMVGDAISCFKN